MGEIPINPEGADLIKELRFSHPALQNLGPEKIAWMKYFYHNNVPAVAAFLDNLINIEDPSAEIIDSFNHELGVLIEHRIKDLLAVDSRLEPEANSFITQYLSEYPEIFSVVTAHYLEPDHFDDYNKIYSTIVDIKKQRQELAEKAKAKEGMEGFMELAGSLAEQMSIPDNNSYNLAAFMTGVNNLLALKEVVEPQEIKAQINRISSKHLKEGEKSIRKGCVRLLKALEIRGFFK